MSIVRAECECPRDTADDVYGVNTVRGIAEMANRGFESAGIRKWRVREARITGLARNTSSAFTHTTRAQSYQESRYERSDQ
jgi:hypothetical protein